MADTSAPARARIRVPAGSQPSTYTADTYQNVVARLGIGTGNLQSASTYGYNPISRNRMLLDFMYRGSWIVGKVVDVVAEDMTRAGVKITSTLDPADIAAIHDGARNWGVWDGIADGIKWSRLYGGAILVILIDGQDPATPLNTSTVGRGQFRGLLPLDRWMIQPSFTETVRDLGPDLGKPVFYDVTASAPAFQGERVHYSRVIRLEGIKLPYWQSQTEQFWGMSVIERLYDRLVAFDSTTAGAAQLVFKAYLRTYKVEGLRQILGGPEAAQKGLMAQLDAIRAYQSTEGLTLMDAKDEMTALTYSFGGLSDVLARFEEQIAGAADIPLVRMFGQSPAGFSTGEADLRTHYDGINAQQNARLRPGVKRVYELLCRSELGIEPPDGYAIAFEPLWQLSATERATIAKTNTDTILAAEVQGTISHAVALKELKGQSEETGIFTNITDADIAEAEAEPPAPDETAVNPPGPDEIDADAPASPVAPVPPVDGSRLPGLSPAA
ncbi:DUF1073 domain-containing protein [Methylobacterium sp. 1030]|uniref:DUF1073 domain-containing protein n=1 Tax=Methylobacterium sp. 1030 TaxID=3156404 RepID=UPI00339B75DC